MDIIEHHDETFEQTMEEFSNLLLESLGETWNGDINYKKIGDDFISKLAELNVRFTINKPLNSYKYSNDTFGKNRRKQQSYNNYKELVYSSDIVFPELDGIFDMIHNASSEDKALYVSLYCIFIFYTRAIKNGKGYRVFSYYLFEQLYKEMPQTAIELLVMYTRFGYFKDLINIMDAIDSDNIRNKCVELFTDALGNDFKEIFGVDCNECDDKKKYTLINEFNNKLQSMSIRDIRKKYRKLKLTMAGKYIPRQNKKHDKYRKYLVNSFFNNDNDNVKYYNFTDMLYRKFLSILNILLDVVEVKMCSNKWSDIFPSKTPSLAMNKYRKAFLNESLEKDLILADDETGNRTINPDRIELRKRTINDAIEGKLNGVGLDAMKFAKLIESSTNKKLSSAERKVIHSQFSNIYMDLVKQLKDCMSDNDNPFQVVATIDVSSSMSCAGVMGSAIILGIMTTMLSSITTSFITFSDNPQVIKLDTTKGDIIDWYNYVKNSNWGGSTDIDKANMLIIDIMNKHREKNPDYKGEIKHIIFTDGQFNGDFCRYGDDWNTFVDRMKTRFTENNLSVPETIFWNMNSNSPGFMATGDMKGIQLTSGNNFGVFMNILTNNVVYVKDGDDTVADIDTNRSLLKTLCSKDYHPIIDIVFSVSEGGFFTDISMDYVLQYIGNYM
jgi:hypothetical protein